MDKQSMLSKKNAAWFGIGIAIGVIGTLLRTKRAYGTEKAHGASSSPHLSIPLNYASSPKY